MRTGFWCRGHPHGCGESGLLSSVSSSDTGSSPRVWGKQAVNDYSDRLNCRVIPTGVGKAWYFELKLKMLTGHPHGCGESRPSRTAWPVILGSSPRVWGKRYAETGSSRTSRVIPTGVGKACSDEMPVITICGSSPRVWGKHIIACFACPMIRVIPTGVGKARRFHNSAKPSSGHPHGCGESRHGSSGACAECGSSPRVWGKLWGFQRVTTIETVNTSRNYYVSI